MSENIVNNNYVKALSLLGGLAAIGFSIYKRTGFLKGAGNYIVAALSGSLVGMGIYFIKDKSKK